MRNEISIEARDFIRLLCPFAPLSAVEKLEFQDYAPNNQYPLKN